VLCREGTWGLAGFRQSYEEFAGCHGELGEAVVGSGEEKDVSCHRLVERERTKG
jgi:hypothetical protein